MVLLNMIPLRLLLTIGILKIGSMCFCHWLSWLLYWHRRWLTGLLLCTRLGEHRALLLKWSTCIKLLLTFDSMNKWWRCRFKYGLLQCSLGCFFALWYCVRLSFLFCLLSCYKISLCLFLNDIVRCLCQFGWLLHVRILHAFSFTTTTCSHFYFYNIAINIS